MRQLLLSQLGLLVTYATLALADFWTRFRRIWGIALHSAQAQCLSSPRSTAIELSAAWRCEARIAAQR